MAANHTQTKAADGGESPTKKAADGGESPTKKAADGGFLKN
jgi:hypothetical protein